MNDIPKTMPQLALAFDAGVIASRVQDNIEVLRSKLDKDYGYISPKDFARNCVALRELRQARDAVSDVRKGVLA